MTPEYVATMLRESGAIVSENVYDAFAEVRRGAFVPQCWVRGADGVRQFLARSDDPAANAAWLEAVYDDNSLVTRLDERGVAVSSSSQPTVMARMLEALDAQPGQRVLEIGTGTGYNTALLCHLVGDQNVTSVDIDPELVAAARERLADQGFEPHLAVGDGRIAQLGEGWDRLIATCGVRTVPAEWIRQCRPGAVLVVNVGYGTARLEVDPEGTASGAFIDGYTAFMLARDAAGAADPGLRIDADALAVQRGCAAEIPERIHSEAFQVVLSLLAPDLTQVRIDADRSAFADEDGHRLLSEYGVLRGDLELWDAIEAAYGRWSDWGFPDLHDLAITVGANGHTDLQPRAATTSSV
jgi:protein-L-isoaspartate O-methyltransferase